jgi:cytochrome c-type biogenesis protein
VPCCAQAFTRREIILLSHGAEEIMNELAAAFVLGNTAILTNACLLPLYPGLLAFLAGSAHDHCSRRATGWLGALVLAGILSAMILIGLLLYVIQQSFSVLLPYLLPLIYGIVILFGVLLLVGRSPFARLSTAQAPLLRSPYTSAFLYGLLLGPMTLPCTGPIITTAFLLGIGDARALADGLLYFLAFGLGFGWPLVALSLVAAPAQRRLVGWLTRHHSLLNRAAGILLIAIGLFGIITELLPQFTPLELEPSAWGFYWTVVAVLIVLVSIISYRTANMRSSSSRVSS